MKIKQWCYGLGVAILIASLSLAVFGTMSAFDEAVDTYEKYPTVTYGEYKTWFDRLNAKDKEMPSLDAYLERQYELALLEGAARKLDKKTEPLDPRYGRGHIVLSATFLINDYVAANHRLVTDPGTDAKDFSRKTSEATARVMSLKTPARVDWQVMLYFWTIYLAVSRVLAAAHYVSKHIELKNKLVPAIFGDHMFPAAILGFEYMVWKYPVEMSPMEQFRRAYQLITYALGTLLWLSCGAFKAFAQDQAPRDQRKNEPREFTVSGSSLYLGKYLGLDGAVFHPGGVVQSNVTVAHRSGVYADLWKSEPTGARHLVPNYGNEQDYTLGFVAGIGSKAKFNLSATYFNVFPMLQMPRGDLIQLSARIESSVKITEKHSAAPHLWVRSVQPLKDGKPKGGYFIHPGISHSWRAAKRVSLSSYVETVRDSGAFGYNQGWITRFSSSFSVQIGKGFSLIAPTCTFTKPITDTRDGRKFEHAVGVGIAFAH